MANTAYSNFIQNIRNAIFIRQQKMVANGKLHSLLKIIFLSCWCFWNTEFALLGYRILPKGKVLPVSVILLTTLLS